MASNLFGARPWRRKYVWLGSLAAVLAAGAFLSLLVLGYPQFRGQRPLLSEDEAALLGLINDYRLQFGRPALKVSPTLSAAARWMSEDMAEHDYFSRTDSLGRETVQRMADFGYTPTDTWGLEEWNEIISAGHDTPETVFEVLRNSSTDIMRGETFVVAGVGKAHNPQSQYTWYWTLDFGNYEDAQAISLTPSPTGIPSSSHLTPTIMPSPTPTPTPTPSPPATLSPASKRNGGDTGWAGLFSAAS